MGEVRVGKDDFVDVLVGDEVGKFLLRHDGIPSGYSGPASEGGYERPSMPGIWAAVKATTLVDCRYGTQC